VDLPNVFMACGDGFDDRTAPWGGEHMGKGSTDGGWYNNIRIPFTTSIRVTLTGTADDVLYFIVRGAEDIPVVVGDVRLPPNARLRVDVNDLVMQPLDTLNVINAPDGLQGITFLHTLAFESGTVSPPVTGENCLEGCYHAYSPANAPFPGYIVATGTEDLFDRCEPGSAAVVRPTRPLTLLPLRRASFAVPTILPRASSGRPTRASRASPSTPPPR